MSALSLSKKNKAPKAPKEPKPKKEKKSKKAAADASGADLGSPVAAAKSKKAKTKKIKTPAVKVPADTYTFILFIAWIALTAACVFLYLDISSYK